jgi:hypothetical protein
VFEERAWSQNGEIFQRQNSEIILNETQPRSLDTPIVISDDSNDSSVKVIHIKCFQPILGICH